MLNTISLSLYIHLIPRKTMNSMIGHTMLYIIVLVTILPTSVYQRKVKSELVPELSHFSPDSEKSELIRSRSGPVFRN